MRSALRRERSWGPRPGQAELLALPTESLSHSYPSWFADVGGQPLPEPVLQAGSAMLLGADLLHQCLAGPPAGEVGAGQAAAYGQELGRICAPLLAQRWEEGRENVGQALLLRQENAQLRQVDDQLQQQRQPNVLPPRRNNRERLRLKHFDSSLAPEQ